MRRSSSSDRLRELLRLRRRTLVPPPPPKLDRQSRVMARFITLGRAALRVLRYTCVVVMVVVVITIIAAAIVVVIGPLLASSHALSPSLFFSRPRPGVFLSLYP